MFISVSGLESPHGSNLRVGSLEAFIPQAAFLAALEQTKQ